MTASRAIVPLALFAMLGCSDSATSTTDDTGDISDTLPDFDEGCILVDGGGGYAFIADALTVAGDGSTIELCEGTFDQAVVVDKSVSIVGPGPDLLVWTAPINEPAVKVVAGGMDLTISGFSVESSRHGIEIEGASNISIEDVAFTAVDGSGVKVTDSADVLIDGSQFTSPGSGGVDVYDSSVTVANSTFETPIGFAARADGDSELDVQGSSITGVTFSETTDGSINDGFALWVTAGAVLRTTANTLDDNFVHVYTDEAHMYLDGNQITGGTYGIFGAFGETALSGVTITDPELTGLRVVADTHDIVINDTVISGDPEVVNPLEYDFYNYVGGAATLATNGLVTINDSRFEGYNDLGVVILPTQDLVTVEMNRVEFVNNGRYGLRMQLADAVLNDVSITDTRLVDELGTVNNEGSIYTGMAASFWSCPSVAWTGGSVVDSEYLGVISYDTTLTADGLDIRSNNSFGMWIYQSTGVLIQNSTFSESSYLYDNSYTAGLALYYSDAVVDRNTWSNNLESRLSEYEYNKVIYGTLYGYQSQDLLSYLNTALVISNNTFEDGSYGIQIQDGSGTEITDNTWARYNSRPIYLYGQTTDRTLIARNTMNDVGSYALYCIDSAVDVEELTVATVPGYNTSYTYYTDGKETGYYEYTYQRQAVYADGCDMLLQDVDLSGVADHAVYLFDTVTELLDVNVTASSTVADTDEGTISVVFGSVSGSLLASNVSVDGTGLGYGFHVQYTGGNEGGQMLVDGVSANNGSGHGIVLEDLVEGTFEFSNLSGTGNGGSGLVIQAADVEVDGTSFTQNAQYGLYFTGSYNQYYDSGGNIYYAWEVHPAQVSNVSATDNGQSGVFVEATEVTLLDSTTTDNGGYGLECGDEVSWDSCSNVTYSPNDLGDISGCSTSCTD